MGKTSALKAARPMLDDHVSLFGGVALWLRLRSYSGGQHLVQDLFRGDAFTNWAAGDHNLHVYLDDFDECHLRIETLAALFIDELHRFPFESIRNRLRLQIACRTFAWPISLEAGLREIWGDEQFAAFELAPLREADVATAARANDIDPVQFLAEIDRAEAAALASRPITLTLLLRLYRRFGAFPKERSQLYEQGCLELCREPNPDRRDAGRIGKLTQQQRFAVAARIAAATIFTGQDAVSDEPDTESENSLLVAELSGSTEDACGETFRVDEAAVRETLQTALFSGRALGTAGWAHQSLGEFLAAHYLVRQSAALPQITSLLVHPGDSEKRIAPQLREVAAWLAGMSTDVFREIAKSDPNALLLSDLSSVQDQDRFDLVEALLQGDSRSWPLYRDWALRSRYAKLNHNGLARQLRTYILDRSKSDVVRCVAVNISEECQCSELQGDLVQIALDHREPYDVRVASAYSLVRTGDEEAKRALRPLLTTPLSEDSHESLKGCALRAMWPRHLTAEELFAVLGPSRSDVFGEYASFLYANPIKALTPTDLPAALDWLANLPRTGDLPHELEDVVTSILHRSWENLDVPGVEQAFARASVGRLLQHDEVLGERGDLEARGLLQDDERRRRVLAAVLPLVPNPNRNLWTLKECGLAETRDVEWMLTRLQSERSQRMVRRWANIISTVLDHRNLEDLEKIWKIREADIVLREAFAPLYGPIPVLREAFSPLFDPVSLDSPQAEKMKTNHYRWVERQQLDHDLHEDPLPHEPPVLASVIQDLEKFESGDLDAWWHLNHTMIREPSGRIQNFLEPDLTSLPAWLEASYETKERIKLAAERYVREQTPAPEKWIGKGSNTEFIIHLPDYAGYRALELLLREDPNRLDQLTPEDWQRWAPVIVAYHHRTNADDDTAQRLLVQLAYPHSQDVIIETIVRIIDRGNDGLSIEESLDKVSLCWDERLEMVFLEMLLSPNLSPQNFRTLLTKLLKHGSVSAESQALRFVEHLVPSDIGARDRAVIAAQSLVAHARDAGWSTVWPAIQADAEFGAEVISHVAWVDHYGEQTFQKLSEPQVADLYMWLVTRYPHDEDPIERGVHSVSRREAIGHWRDSALRQLQRRGTVEAVEGIRKIAAQFSHLDWLDRVLGEAQEITRRATWQWPNHRDVLALVADGDHRLILNADQLLDVVVESLQRLESKLQKNESRAVVDLWNIVSRAAVRGIAKNLLGTLRSKLGKGRPLLTIDGFWREFGGGIVAVNSPKEENLFSDYVKRHLDDDLIGRGIVINREVQNRRRDITDIRINAVERGTKGEVKDTVTVIVEAKGCWNSDLDKAMKTQLVDRYLQPDGINHGLYLIGWYSCDDWDPNDPRMAQTPRITLDAARTSYTEQAASLSVNGLTVRVFVLDTSLSSSSEDDREVVVQ